MPAAARPTSVAVLDDYHGLAASYLRDVDTTKLDITVYRDTILPSPGGAAERLIDRLHRHEVLVTMRERTPIYRELIDALPNLKVILTTGLRNLGIDVEYAKGKGIVVAGTPNAPVP
jgi:lactate dehydrogenase-like 2-hydroxyacid dehydrogenase